MNAAAVRDYVLARALEEGDREGRLLEPAARRRASQEAHAQGARGEAFLVLRSRLVCREVGDVRPRVALARRSGGLWLPPAWVTAGLAFVLGAAFDHLGGGRRVHVLAIPLTGLVAWNLAIYLALALGALARRRRGAAQPGDRGPETEEPASPPWIVRLGARLGERALRAIPGEGAGDAATCEARALARYVRDWLAAASPLVLARARVTLHLAALGFCSGVIASLYLRGLLLAYEATWESTFLGPEGARTLLGLILGPAAALLGFELPDAEHLALLREQPQGAAPWIHLWVVNLVALVVLPRSVLAALGARRARRLAAELPFDWRGDPYALRVSAPERGGDREATVWPYSFQPSTRARGALGELLLELLGARARLRFEEPLPYGASLPPPAAQPSGRACRVLLFNLAQAPEQEVHGRLVEEARRAVEGGAGDALLLVCVDEGPYVERMGSDRLAEERVEERRRSWRRTVREAGLRAVFVRLDGSRAAVDLEALRGGLYPERAVGVLA